MPRAKASEKEPEAAETEETRELLSWDVLRDLAKDEGFYAPEMTKKEVIELLTEAGIDVYKDEELAETSESGETVFTEDEIEIAKTMEEMGAAALTQVAEKHGIETKDLSKTELIEAILLAERERNALVAVDLAPEPIVEQPVPSDPNYDAENGTLTITLQDLAIALAAMLPPGARTSHQYSETFSRSAHKRGETTVALSLPDANGIGRRYEITLPDSVQLSAVAEI